MAGSRNSGTRSIGPTSGVISSPKPSSQIDQQTSSTTLNSIVIDADGFLRLVAGSSIYTVIQNNDLNVGNVNNPTGADSIAPIDQILYSTTEERQLASAYFPGGMGIEKDLAVGGFIYGRIAQANTATTSSNISVLQTNADLAYYPVFTTPEGLIIQGAQLYGDPLNQDTSTGGLTYNPFYGKLSIERGEVKSDEVSTSPTTGAFTVTGGVGILGDVYIGASATVEDATNSTAIDTGALVVTGGVGIGKDLNVGGNIYPAEVNTGTIGAQDLEWADAYLNKVYTKFLGSTASNLTIAPGGGMTDVFGDIRVRGQNPIGTAPVITNVLYVTMDGNDTNDGRAQDPSRACRTIGGAINSPYYQPGTQIQVSPGRYLENNPLDMNPYTSVRGSDIRTTFIEPINKTQDLFHMNSGCYLNYMNFLNGRSGRLPGAYQQKFNRGAYATSFPPQVGDSKIDLFQSPYVQNCTNQSGPWLNDGTMFVPNQTVQVPAAVGMGSWEANTTTITVSVSTGTISIGHSINAGKQNPGFFNGRTLLLANKPFIQSQTVAWVDATFNSGSFTYNQLKCSRDTGLVVNAIAMDLLQDSTSDSQFAGIQYWNQDTYTGEIPSEITATIAAITFLKSISIVSSPTNQSTVDTLYDKIIDILNVGTLGITDDLSYGGLPSTDPDVLADYQYLQDNKTTLQETVIDWITSNYPSLVYSQELCYRDVGYIVDSVCFDLLHGGNIQSIKSGVYYYNYSNTSALEATNEVPATTAAYNFMKSIISNIIEAKTIANPYQVSVTQVTGLDAGTARQSTTVKGLIDTITGIIRNGPEWAGPKTPINLTTNESVGIINAYNLLIANIPFIQAEVIAFIDQTMNSFEYNRQLCYRDAGIILENLVYDAVFGGNEKSVESGKAYYRGVTSVIAGQETQTIGAIDHIVDLCEKILINEVCDVISPPANIPSNSQVINTNLSGGEIIIPSLEKLANITTNIILNGPDTAPELYNGIIAQVPFVDVVTTMLDDTIPLTTGEYDEWGNPNVKKYYNYIKTYSPYDNVKAQDYPSIYVSTGLHDSQVQYWEPAKWVAKLRVFKTDNNAIYLDTNMNAGHGGASGRFEALKELAKEFSFLLDLEKIRK